MGENLIVLVGALATALIACADVSASASPNPPPPTSSAPAAYPATASPPAPTTASLPALKAGTLVVIQLAEVVSTRTAHAGDLFKIKLVMPIVADGRVVIPAGAMGVGQVVDAGKPGFGGKPAKLVLAARKLDFPGQAMPLRSFHLGATGVDTSDAALAVSMIPYAGIVALFIQGGHVEIPAGALATAKLAQDFTPTSAVSAPPPPAPQSPAKGPPS